MTPPILYSSPGLVLKVCMSTARCLRQTSVPTGIKVCATTTRSVRLNEAAFHKFISYL